ncbi:hypothetical protein COOONC_17331 [Cooperia oncophora]
MSFQCICSLTGNFSDRIRNFSGRVTRKMKTFVSRPIRDSALRRFISKVKAKREAERDSLLEEYGYAMNGSKTLGQRMKIINLCDMVAVLDRSGQVIPIYTGLFHRFTLSMTGSARTQESENEDISADNMHDLPLNGEVVLEVEKGTIGLVPMPTIPLV